jgi:hypothetical protein
LGLWPGPNRDSRGDPRIARNSERISVGVIGMIAEGRGNPHSGYERPRRRARCREDISLKDAALKVGI